MRAHDRKNHGQTRARAGDHRAGAAAADVVAEPVAAEAEVAQPTAPVETLGKCPPPLDVPQDIKPLDATWRGWIADNALRRCSPESMLATVTAAGIDPAQTSGFIATLSHSPIYGAAERLRERYERYAQAMQNVQAVHEAAADYAVVEKRAGVSRDEFIERYVHGCRPVVLTDIARDWPALQRWSFAEFKRRYGSMTVQVQAGRDKDADFEVNKVRHRHDTNFAAFLDRVATSGVTNDEYLTANNELLRRPDFVRPARRHRSRCPTTAIAQPCRSAGLAVDGPRRHAYAAAPRHADAAAHADRRPQALALRLAALGATSLYNDFEVYSPVDFESPDLERFPEAAKVRVLDVVVEPGETDVPAAGVVAPGDLSGPVYLPVASPTSTCPTCSISCSSP